jgi:uncharacterized protein (UPF0333 family)
MDSRAQVSFEYLAIIAILVLIASVILVFTTTMVSNKEGIKSAISEYTEKVPEMLGLT